MKYSTICFLVSFVLLSLSLLNYFNKKWVLRRRTPDDTGSFYSTGWIKFEAFCDGSPTVAKPGELPSGQVMPERLNHDFHALWFVTRDGDKQFSSWSGYTGWTEGHAIAQKENGRTQLVNPKLVTRVYSNMYECLRDFNNRYGSDLYYMVGGYVRPGVSAV